MASILKSVPLLRPMCQELRIVRCRHHRKKTPKWADPDDLSWAEPLFERQRKLQTEGVETREPSMLHMVYRVKPLKGRPYWEKETIRNLNLHKRMGTPQIHKNIPDVNDMLKSVNHLIKIIPITFPDGIPQTKDDFANCLLRDNGELVIRKTINPVEVVNLKKKTKDVWTMDIETFTKEHQKKLDSYDLNAEYFPPKYVYKYNQDKKEYRYFGNRNIGANREWN